MLLARLPASVKDIWEVRFAIFQIAIIARISKANDRQAAP